jgi:hypothetical protein
MDGLSSMDGRKHEYKKIILLGFITWEAYIGINVYDMTQGEHIED